MINEMTYASLSFGVHNNTYTQTSNLANQLCLASALANDGPPLRKYHLKANVVVDVNISEVDCAVMQLSHRLSWKNVSKTVQSSKLTDALPITTVPVTRTCS